MSTTINRYYSKIFWTVIAVLAGVMPAYSLSSDFYAGSSRLSSGNWAKIEVKESGMQFISNATLKTLGFSDPDKVNVYGYGGRMLPESLYASMPDDLPAIPSVRTPSGIVFFGHGNVSWDFVNKTQTQFSHSGNPYSDNAYYFISDIDPSRTTAPDDDRTPGSTDSPITSFRERLLHEQDIIALVNTGRTLFGEDFRTQRKRSFTFDLPGNIGDAVVSVRFGSNTSNSGSSIMLSANDTRLPSTASDQISALNSDLSLLSVTTTTKTVENPGDKLNLTIEYSTSGTLFSAALDFIEVEYNRELKLTNDELYFYLNRTTESTVAVDNCSESTVIWDVTDPVNPVNVKYTLSGSRALFSISDGYHEYVAFNPSKISRQTSPAGKISNQDIHGMDIPDMVIVTPSAFKSAAQRLANLHAATDGLKVAVLCLDEIYNEFSSGNPDVTAFRKLLKMWYDKGMAADGNYTRYCLLFGRPSYDNKMATQIVKNAGYPRVPIWQAPSTGNILKNGSYSTDDYIGMLDDNVGTLTQKGAKIQVAVGRMPVKTLQEANVAIDKLEKYIRQPKYGSWRNNVMLIADDQDAGKHLNQAELVYSALRSNGNGEHYVYEKLYLDAYTLSYGATGPIYPEAKQRMFDKFAEGVAYVDYIGHANPRSWGHESLLTWTDINSMTNTNLPFIYAATCEFLRWDDDDVSGAEILWLNPTAGVIGMICPSREVYINSNGALNERTAKYMYMRKPDGSAMRVGDVMVYGKNDYLNDDNKLRYGLLGDPALMVLTPDYCVRTSSFNGVELADSDDMPVVKARSSFQISGIVTDFDGNKIEDFNGIVEIQLYDSEIVITTHGNGSDGSVETYNDRKTRLYSGRVKVADGEWTATINLPSEIENNFTPALLSFYAYDDGGREANGSFDKFYVYGYNEEAPDDSEGPVIKDFYMNSADFTDGSPVSPSPILYASFSDESGINVADSGIGHNMIVSLDNETFYNDVNLYYTADADNHLAGSIAYPLQGISPGEHTLRFTVWDNANNSSFKELSFYVAASWIPEITKLATDVSPATTSVNFLVATDGANGNMECTIEVYDLNGRRVWTGSAPSLSSSATSVSLGWNLCDENGVRVQRGIYIYRAIVKTSEGATIVKSNKLAVAAQ